MTKPTGLALREIYIDARDLQSDADPENPLTPEEYVAVLTARGQSKLAEHQLVKSFSAVVRTLDPTYVLGVDYQLGDTITVVDERLGITVDAVVQAVERSVGENGEGMLGKLVARDGGTFEANGWATVGEGGKATRSKERTKYRIMERLDDTHVRLLIL